MKSHKVSSLKLSIVSLAALVLAGVACSSDVDNTPMSTGGGAGTPSGGAGMSSGGAAGGTPTTAGGGAGGSTSAGQAGASGGGAGGSGGAPNLMPTKLSETGLFTDIKAQTLAPGVYAFEPQYPLWSDSATKKRWVYMPPGGKIVTDASLRGMEYWEYPAGFKLWKEFSRDGKRIETRLLLKKTSGLTDWYMVAFKWNEDGSDAVAVPDGEMNAMGTQHDIPAEKACTGCHSKMNDNVLGFSALQLSHNLPGSMTLAQADQLGWFTKSPPASGFTLPGTDVEKQALGYMHSNCGMCHNTYSAVWNTKASLDLWTRLDQIQSVQTTRAYLSTVCAAWPGAGGKSDPIKSCPEGQATGTPMDVKDISKAKRIAPKDAANSSIHDLMSLRVAGEDSIQMPPLGTEIVDDTGLAAVDAWINSLPAQ